MMIDHTMHNMDTLCSNPVDWIKAMKGRMEIQCVTPFMLKI